MGIDYVWNDTCCIDKSSSAELSEAINSMYEFYAKSAVCFAYLDDVDDYPQKEAIEASLWFTRAWTLQELVAPKEIYVYSKGWKSVGTKQSLSRHLSQASHVPEKVLLDPFSIEEFSVAEKMQWAAWRQATREEDEAYSLMGIFAVNMPPLYGEGRQKAFRRLQIEIMQQGHDHTIFAWSQRMVTGDMLATSARDFMTPYTYRRMELETYVDMFALQKAKLDYNMTNIGLHIELPVVPIPNSEDMFLAFIACRSIPQDSLVAICLARRTLGRLTRWYRTEWHDCTILHIRDLTGLAFNSKELWIAKLQFRESPVVFPSLVMTLKNHGGIFIIGHYHDFSYELGDGTPQSFKIEVTPDKPLNEVIMFWNQYHSEFPDNLVGRIGLFLAIGELNSRIWVFPHVAYYNIRLQPGSDYDRFSPDYHPQRALQTNQHYHNVRRKLQRDCKFPNGIVWRNSRSKIVFVEYAMDETLFLNPDNHGQDQVSPLYHGKWDSDLQLKDLQLKWCCQLESKKGYQVLTIELQDDRGL